MRGDGRSTLSGGTGAHPILATVYADWGMAAARAAARMCLQRVRFVGLTRAQVRLVARVGGAGPRPSMAEAAVGDYPR